MRKTHKHVEPTNKKIHTKNCKRAVVLVIGFGYFSLFFCFDDVL